MVTAAHSDDARVKGRIAMKTTTLVTLLLVALAGCAAKKQIMESSEECIAARDAALRASAACERCCATPKTYK